MKSSSLILLISAAIYTMIGLIQNQIEAVIFGNSIFVTSALMLWVLAAKPRFKPKNSKSKSVNNLKRSERYRSMPIFSVLSVMRMQPGMIIKGLIFPTSKTVWATRYHSLDPSFNDEYVCLLTILDVKQQCNDENRFRLSTIEFGELIIEGISQQFELVGQL